MAQVFSVINCPMKYKINSIKTLISRNRIARAEANIVMVKSSILNVSNLTLDSSSALYNRNNIQILQSKIK